MDSKISCRLCFDFPHDFVDIFQDFEGSTIAAILTQHIKCQIDGSSDYLCRTCWTNTKNFHIFYKKTLQKIHLKSIDFVEQNIFDSHENQTAKNSSNNVMQVELSLSRMDTAECIVKTEEMIPEIAFDLQIKREENLDGSYDPIKCAEGEKNQSSDNEKQTRELSLVSKCQNNAPPPLLWWKPDEGNQSSHDEEQSPKLKGKSEINDVCDSKYIKLDDADESSNQRLNKRTTNRRKNCQTTKSREKDTATEDAQIREFCNMKCEICCDKFETFAEAKKHYQTVHNTVGYLKCCQKKFVKRYLVLEHIQRHLNPEEFKCDICGKYFANKESLKNHMEVHAPRTFKCDMCSSSFAAPSKLINHKRRCHCSEEEKKFRCDQCDKSFIRNGNLRQHIRATHERAYTQVCDICAKVCRNKTALRKHMKGHPTVFRPELECNVCGRWLENERSLSRHLMRHQGTKCSICKQVMQSSNSLSNHMLYVHGKKRHKCTICDKTYTKGLLLREHMAAIHTGEVLYTCQYCKKPFKSNSNMHCHLKKDHFTEWARDSIGKKLEEEKEFPHDSQVSNNKFKTLVVSPTSMYFDDISEKDILKLTNWMFECRNKIVY